MITLATTLTEATQATGELRAGGTDVQDRRRHHITSGAIVDITRIPDLDQIEFSTDAETRIGALVTVSRVGDDTNLRAHYPGLTLPAGSIATPQIRNMATMGGVLCQRNRCWYYRHPDFDCYRKGGDGCPAREGDHRYHACFDLGPCVAVHPSTVGLALLTYDAEVSVTQRGRISVKELYGDGTLASHDHTLQAGEIITHIHLPPPTREERAGYFRLISRAEAEWPLVEVCVRLVVEAGVIALAKVGLGGVAPIPLRLPQVEAALLDQPATAATFTAAAGLAAQGATPLPLTGYKVPMIERSVLETLERAVAVVKG